MGAAERHGEGRGFWEGLWEKQLIFPEDPRPWEQRQGRGRGVPQSVMKPGLRVVDLHFTGHNLARGWQRSHSWLGLDLNLAPSLAGEGTLVEQGNYGNTNLAVGTLGSGPKYPQMGVSAEHPTGRAHLPPGRVPLTVWPGSGPGVSLSSFYSRVDSEGKWLSQGRQAEIGKWGLPAPTALRGGLRWQPLSPVAPLSHQSAGGLGAWRCRRRHRAGLISSSEMPSHPSPLGVLIYYVSGG